MSLNGEWVDERFFRPVLRRCYGPEVTTKSMKYWSKGRDIGEFKSAIYIEEFYWIDNDGKDQVTTRQEINEVYQRLKKAQEAWKAANRDVQPYLLERVFGQPDTVLREADTWRTDYGARLNGITAHLIQTCADIADREYELDTTLTWAPYPLLEPIPFGQYRPSKALRGRMIYPFLVVREAQSLLSEAQPPLELEIGRVMGRISKAAQMDPVFGFGSDVAMAERWREELQRKGRVQDWRNLLTNILRKHGVRQPSGLPVYEESQLPSYAEANGETK